MSVRGLFTIGTGGGKRTFAVASTDFVELFKDGTHAVLGTVLNDSLPVSLVASAQQVLLAAAGTAYVMDLATNAFAAIPGATFNGQVAEVAYIDGFFIVLIADTNRFFVSNILDAANYDLNGSALVSVFPDNLVGMIADQGNIWFWSSTKLVPYYVSGGNFPLDVRTDPIEQGLAAKNSKVRLDNTIFWLGSDDRGTSVVWRAQSFSPTRVSNHALEHAMQLYTRVDDAVAYSFQMDGHYFYHLYFPTPSKSWRYDTAIGMWHEVSFLEPQTGIETAHRSQVHTFNFGKHLVGDWASNKVYDMEIPRYNNGVWDFADDNGSPIKRTRRMPHLSQEQKFQMHHQLQVYLESGLGPTPALPGTEAPTNLILADPTGAIWSVGVDNTGVLTSDPGFGTPMTLYLNDMGNTTSWQVTIDAVGVIQTVAATFNPSRLQVFNLSSGTTRWIMYVDAVGVLNVDFFENVTRAPMLSLTYSDDGAHTFGNERSVSIGKTGEFSERVMFRRLGRARDRVYQVTGSDPVPYRLIASYLEVA